MTVLIIWAIYKALYIAGAGCCADYRRMADEKGWIIISRNKTATGLCTFLWVAGIVQITCSPG